ncbi:hypothetical protein [Undibacterium sp. Ji49W]|uniref:hypothetical protein n=1 Tax=Undibacterium sp. Ji49W TaxID=3413040 RepID=UPI003BF024D8
MNLKKRNIFLLLFVPILAYCEFSDEINSRLYGTAVDLVSASKPIEDSFFTPNFVHMQVAPDNSLRLALRAPFYDSGDIARPYLTVDDAGHGVLHIDVKRQLQIVGKKCEFQRQLVIQIPAQHWQKLNDLALYNHNTDDAAGSSMPISDRAYLHAKQHESVQQVAWEKLTESQSC